MIGAFHRARVALLALALIACSTSQPDPPAARGLFGGGFIPGNTGGGSSGGLTGANLSSGGGDLVIADNASATAPAAGFSKLFSSSIGGRTQLSQFSPVGRAAALQPTIAQRSIGMWIPSGGGSTTTTALGIQGAVATGTATGRTQASTNLFTGTRRVGFVSAAGAGSAAGVRTSVTPFWIGNAAGVGGFYTVFRFGVSDASIVTTGRTFVGLQSSISAPTDVSPSGLTNVIGVCSDATDTVLQICASGAVAQAKTSLGANFPINGTTNVDVYELVLYAPPNASTVTYQVTRLNTGDVATGSLTGAQLPTSTTFLATQLWRANGGTAAAVGIDLLSMYIESEI